MLQSPKKDLMLTRREVVLYGTISSISLILASGLLPLINEDEFREREVSRDTESQSDLGLFMSPDLSALGI